MEPVIITESRDIALIRFLAERSFLPTYLPFISPEQVHYMFDKMYSPDALRAQMEDRAHRFFIANVGSETLGFASVEADCELAGRAKLHKLYVLPEAQGKAVGFSLMNTMESVARAELQEWLFLNVNRYNKAVEFYKRQGYEIYLEEDIDIGNGYFMNDYRMQKALATK